MTKPVRAPAQVALAIHNTPVSRHRFHLLDALRGIAAVLVAVGHTKYLAHRLGLQNPYLAVDFFFCLSGFVVASSYESRLQSGLRTRDFIAARIIRLYPVYLLSTLLGFLFASFFVHAPDRITVPGLFLALFLIPNLRILPIVFLFPLNVPAWSLLLEILANIAYALMIKIRAAGVWPLSVIAIATFVALAYGITHGNTLYDAGVTNLHAQAVLGLVRVIPSFALGVLTMRLFRSVARFQLSGWLLWAVPAAIVLALILVLVSPLAAMQTTSFRLFAIAVLFPAITCIGASANPPVKWTSTCVVLGELSYPLYLIHIFFVEFAGMVFVSRTSSALHQGINLFSVALATATAYLVAKKFDAPIRSMLTNSYRNATARPT